MGKENPSLRIIASFLALFGLIGFLAVVERLFAAAINAWKFHGFAEQYGIDLGANTTLQFLCLSLLAVGVCVILGRMAADKEDRLLNRLVTAASAFYLGSGIILLLYQVSLTITHVPNGAARWT